MVVVGSLLRLARRSSKVENGRRAGWRSRVHRHHLLQAFRTSVLGCMLKNTHVPVAFWRSVGASQNAFFIESYIDELAPMQPARTPTGFRRATPRSP